MLPQACHRGRATPEPPSRDEAPPATICFAIEKWPCGDWRQGGEERGLEFPILCFIIPNKGSRMGSFTVLKLYKPFLTCHLRNGTFSPCRAPSGTRFTLHLQEARPSSGLGPPSLPHPARLQSGPHIQRRQALEQRAHQACLEGHKVPQEHAHLW